MTTLTRKPPTDLSVLTSLRGIAAWWVVLYHTRQLLAPYVSPALWKFLSNGDLAVDMFFVLSGFVIYLNYHDRIEANIESIVDFLFRRFSRIYPLHFLLLVASTVYGVLVYLTKGNIWQGGRWEELPLHFALAHNWGFTDRTSWNVPSWSISTEWLSYALFPFIALLTDWRRWPAWVLILLIVALNFTLHAYFALAELPYAARIPQTGLVRCLIQFTLGTILCAIYLRPTQSSTLLFAAVATMAGTLILSLVLWQQAPVVPITWAALIMALALWPRHWPNPMSAPVFVYIGEVSYATYLLHYLAHVLFKLLFVDAGQPTPLSQTLMFYVAIFACSSALYHTVERPAQRWLLTWKKSALPRKTFSAT